MFIDGLISDLLFFLLGLTPLGLVDEKTMIYDIKSDK